MTATPQTLSSAPAGLSPAQPVPAAAHPAAGGGLVLSVLGAASLCHLLNDLVQSLFLAAYPLFKGGLALSFAQIGLLTFTYQVTASLLQPFVGLYTDKRPLPYSLPFGMAASLSGLLILAFAPSYPALLCGAMMLGTGSSIFHPESARLARLASGGAYGLAQSVFQIGGSAGTALGPLMIALFVLPHGRESLAWFSLVALFGIVVMGWLGRWYAGHLRRRPARAAAAPAPRPRAEVVRAMSLLLALIVSKYFYIASLSSYFIFYLIHRFGVTERQGTFCLFVFLAAMAIGTLAGGPIGDRIGRRRVIWVSILGTLPFSLALPHVGLEATVVLAACVGLVLSSAFPAIVVYGQELMPGRVGAVSGLFFGLAFGIGGLGAALLGLLADARGIDFVYGVCAYLPAIGLLAAFLPDMEKPPAR